MLKTLQLENVLTRIQRSRISPVIILIGAFISLTLVVHFSEIGGWLGFDWKTFFRPAALELLSGRTPYSVAGFYNPPWSLIPFMPLLILPEELSAACVFAIIWLSFGCAGYVLKAKPIALLALLLSPLVMDCALTGGMDWVVPIGLLLPPWLGLFFVLAKPQVGLGIALFWLIDAWQKGGFWAAMRRFAPVGAAYALSFLVFGPYLFNGMQLTEQNWNISMWPVSLAVAIPLMVTAVRQKKIDLAICASPFFSPYVNFYSWSVGLMGMVSNPLAIALSSVVLWIATIAAVMTK